MIEKDTPRMGGGKSHLQRRIDMGLEDDEKEYNWLQTFISLNRLKYKDLDGEHPVHELLDHLEEGVGYNG